MQTIISRRIRSIVDGVALAAFNAAAVFALALSSSLPSHAQFAGATALMTAIQAGLMALGLSIIIIGCWVAGYKILRKGATWDDISHLVLGAFFIGGSVGLGGWAWALLKV